MSSLEQAASPREPESIEEAGLSESTVEHLILKILYFRGDLYGQDLSRATALPFSVINGVIESLKLQHQIVVKRSLGIGNVTAVMALTESGRARAREHLEANQYAGPAPVPLAQYAEMVRRQRPPAGWVTKQSLRDAFAGMVLTERTLSQVGPAISSANSLLLYGKPGDGKTFLIEQLNNLGGAAVFLPYAIECQGNIVQLYDPVYHQKIEGPEEEPSALTVNMDMRPDRRWVKCKRPFIVSGGELTLDMLDLRFNSTSKVYEAPFQLKANNGIYLIDDFGRQRATPAEVLNRWIVPMERRVDYLSFLTGGKMTAPFEAFLVFSTNLNPAGLGDEAFLRRIQYKMLLGGPTDGEFIRIFRNFCKARQLTYPEGLAERFIARRFRSAGKPLRRCHPRDVLTHAINLLGFEGLPMQLNDGVLDRAFESCFLSEEDAAQPATSVILSTKMPTCEEYWSAQVAQVPTAFGRLMFVAGLRDSANGAYRDTRSMETYGEAETARVLADLHQRAFLQWHMLTPQQQRQDVSGYLQTRGNDTGLRQDTAALAAALAPSGAGSGELAMFSQSLGSLAAVTAGETGALAPATA